LTNSPSCAKVRELALHRRFSGFRPLEGGHSSATAPDFDRLARVGEGRAMVRVAQSGSNRVTPGE